MVEVPALNIDTCRLIGEFDAEKKICNFYCPDFGINRFVRIAATDP